LAKYPKTAMEDIERLGWPYGSPRMTMEDIEGQYTWGAWREVGRAGAGRRVVGFFGHDADQKRQGLR